MGEPLLTTAQAAERLGVIPRRVRQIAREMGIEPAHVAANVHLWHARDVARMARRNTKRGPRPSSGAGGPSSRA